MERVDVLEAEGVHTIIIDLTILGANLEAGEWYLGLVDEIARQLNMEIEHFTWWQEHEHLPLPQRLLQFLRRVVLEQVDGPVVIFVDEVDTTLSLDFSDDFFATIRTCYNTRSSDPEYDRLSFVILGVAAPSDLISDRTRTPFNIGVRVNLMDFNTEEALLLAIGFGAPPDIGRQIIERVLYWTGGHPYLTQKVCYEVATEDGRWRDERIDDLVQRLFLAEEARKETNLQFIRDRIRESRERGGMLRVYRRVRAGKRVADEERSVAKSQLKLTGLVRTTSDGALTLRNRIYAQVFDGQWIKENMPVSPAQPAM